MRAEAKERERVRARGRGPETGTAPARAMAQVMAPARVMARATGMAPVRVTALARATAKARATGTAQGTRTAQTRAQELRNEGDGDGNGDGDGDGDVTEGATRYGAAQERRGGSLCRQSLALVDWQLNLRSSCSSSVKLDDWPVGWCGTWGRGGANGCKSGGVMGGVGGSAMAPPTGCLDPAGACTPHCTMKHMAQHPPASWTADAQNPCACSTRGACQQPGSPIDEACTGPVREGQAGCAQCKLRRLVGAPHRKVRYLQEVAGREVEGWVAQRMCVYWKGTEGLCCR